MKKRPFQKQLIIAKEVSLALLFDEKETISETADFDQKGKPIALHFDEKETLSETADLGQKGKPVALLFDEKETRSETTG